jgi:glycosyltransferase involved in cell wall biosynthesis
LLDPDRFRPGQKAREADLVVVTSEHARAALEELSGELRQVRMLRLGVDLDRFGYHAPEAGGRLRVLNVAQLVPRKGQADLLDAIARVREHGVDIELTLVGGGEDRERLEARARELDIEDRVTFRGALGQDDVLAAYRGADVFCLTSYAEGQPVVLMEAMASGLPVVATRVAGTPELVVDGQTGLLVDAGRPDQVAAALERLAGDADLRQRLSRAGRERIEAEHDFHRLVRSLHDLIAEVAVSQTPAGQPPRRHGAPPTSTARD